MAIANIAKLLLVLTVREDFQRPLYSQNNYSPNRRLHQHSK